MTDIVLIALCAKVDDDQPGLLMRLDSASLRGLTVPGPLMAKDDEKSRRKDDTKDHPEAE
ncbi:MAG TPA: hypothetical protein PLM52_04225 [Tabrizicola sp.]|nr:hypothetical protein [Tabrizicola sp.]